MVGSRGSGIREGQGGQCSGVSDQEKTVVRGRGSGIGGEREIGGSSIGGGGCYKEKVNEV